MNNKNSFLTKLMQKDNIRRVVLILGIAAIALIFISSLPQFSSKNQEESSESSLNADEYCKELEARLQSIVTEIDGVGEASVLLTIANSAEIVYNEKSENRTKLIEPKIRGVMVVCEGGDDPVTVSRIINALQSVLDIPSSKICVTPLSQDSTSHKQTQ